MRKLPEAMRPATADSDRRRQQIQHLERHNALAAGRPRTAAAIAARNGAQITGHGYVRPSGIY